MRSCLLNFTNAMLKRRKGNEKHNQGLLVEKWNLTREEKEKKRENTCRKYVQSFTHAFHVKCTNYHKKMGSFI